MIDGLLAAILVMVIAFGAHGVVAASRGQRVVTRINRSRGARITSFDVQSWIKAIRPVTQRGYEKQLPAVLDAIALSLHSGSGFTQAVREAALAGHGPVAQDMKLVVQEIDLGESLTNALLHWSERAGIQSVRLSAASMVMAIEAGGNYVVAVDAASASVRRSLEAAATARTNATQSRASASALVLLPLCISGPVIAFNSGARSFMLHTFVGGAFLVSGIALDVLGWFWMQSLVRRSLA